MKDSCPNCGYRFRWIERARSMSFGFARKGIKCPECGASVNWSRRPWRLMNAGLLISFCALIVFILFGMELSEEPAGYCMLALLVLGSFLTVAGAFTLRFELQGTANKAVERTGATSPNTDDQ